ncbi:MAG: hypothetical protein HZA29_02165 [Candidatus Omnitrophica bacterium]|nr:hypothetical protein [Candidatus Omnitrophota bacterium]
MSEQVQELINKIKTEGLQAADQKAREVEEKARKEARQIIDEARGRADQFFRDAQAEVRKNEQASRLALQQASRDTVISLKKEIQAMLQKIVAAHVGDTLTPERLAHLIEQISRKAVEDNRAGAGIEVAVSPGDLKELRDGFMARLQKHLKQPIDLKSSEDAGKGFTISFDRGKSSFDFSEKALAEYMSVYLNEQVAALLLGSPVPISQLP